MQIKKNLVCGNLELSSIHDWFYFQVEAALTSDPTNAELLKLKGDLLEVIALTDNLIDTLGMCETIAYWKLHPNINWETLRSRLFSFFKINFYEEIIQVELGKKVND